MDSNGKSSLPGDVSSKKATSPNIVSSTATIKRSVQPTALSINEGGRKGVSSKADSGVSASTKRKGKEIVTSHPVVLFRDVKLGPQEEHVRFRLIHFWEARKPLSKVLIGLEMLLIDEEGNAIQGFITPGRMATYLPHMIAGAVYRLNNFYGSNNKDNYRFAEPSITISFSWNYVLSIVEDSSVHFFLTIGCGSIDTRTLRQAVTSGAICMALIDTIGQTRKFTVKVSKLNLTGQVQSLTVTKVLPPQAQEPEADLEEDVIAPTAHEPLQMGNHEDGPFDGHKEAGDGSVKRSADMAETDGSKRPRSG